MYEVLKSKNLLYIEDDKEVLDNISTLLKNFFKEVFTACDGLKGLEVFEKNSIDILLVDIELPSLNGIEIIKNIRKTHPAMPIVIISAYTNTDYLLESVELKLDKYIVKPFTTKKLYDMLKVLAKEYHDEDKVFLGNQIYEKSDFSTKELAFLKILDVKKFVSYDEIYSLWKDTPSDNAIRQFLKKLRKKLDKNSIKTKQKLGVFIDEC